MLPIKLTFTYQKSARLNPSKRDKSVNLPVSCGELWIRQWIKYSFSISVKVFYSSPTENLTPMLSPNKEMNHSTMTQFKHCQSSHFKQVCRDWYKHKISVGDRKEERREEERGSNKGERKEKRTAIKRIESWLYENSSPKWRQSKPPKPSSPLLTPIPAIYSLKTLSPPPPPPPSLSCRSSAGGELVSPTDMKHGDCLTERKAEDWTTPFKVFSSAAVVLSDSCVTP